MSKYNRSKALVLAICCVKPNNVHICFIYIYIHLFSFPLSTWCGCIRRHSAYTFILILYGNPSPRYCITISVFGNKRDEILDFNFLIFHIILMPLMLSSHSIQRRRKTATKMDEKYNFYVPSRQLSTAQCYNTIGKQLPSYLKRLHQKYNFN